MTSLLEKCFDLQRNDFWILVFPHTYDGPARRLELFVGVTIPRHISRQFFGPPVGIRLGPGRVLRTAVPEATIDEDSYPRPEENDIRPALHTRENFAVDPVTQPQPVQFPAQGHFGSRVPPGLPLHPSKRFRGRRRGPIHYTLAKVVSYSFAMRTIMLP